MQILSLNFFIYTLGGVWRPIEWSSNGTKLLYNVFSFCAIALIYFMAVTQFMDIILLVDNTDTLVTNSLMFVSILAVCCKAFIALMQRDRIINLVQMLLNEPCKPRNKDEMAIQAKFDQFIRSCSIKYSYLAGSSCTSVTLRSVLTVMEGNLPYRVWLPYNNTPLTFWFTSIQQIISLIFATLINVGTETLVFGLFLQTCAQIEIFENRLEKLMHNCKARSTLSDKGETVMSEHVRHHLIIYKYAKMINSVFSQILFVQFFGSILVLCTSIYYLSKHIMESEAAGLIVYTICMFAQIFLYCWSGNEVILKSMNIGNAIYQMDWPVLSVSQRKDLLMIMKRSTIPIKFTSSFLITLSLQSYSNILKTSYSAFNVLQQS